MSTGDYPRVGLSFVRTSYNAFDSRLRGGQGSSYYLQQGAGQGRCSEGGAGNDNFAGFHRDHGREGNDRRHFKRQRNQRGRCPAADYGHAWRHSVGPDRPTPGSSGAGSLPGVRPGRVYQRGRLHSRRWHNPHHLIPSSRGQQISKPSPYIASQSHKKKPESWIPALSIIKWLRGSDLN